MTRIRLAREFVNVASHSKIAVTANRSRAKRPAALDQIGSGWQENRRVEKMAEKLARQIVDDIFEAGLQPGNMLDSEAEMLLRYRVGRGTLREALRILEVQGLVTMKPGPGGGPVLRELTTADFARMAKLHLHIRGSTYTEVLQARLALEPLMARLAAETKDEQGLQSLRTAIAEADAIDPDDEAAWRAVCNLFHLTIWGVSGNSVLSLLGESLKEVYATRARPTPTPRAVRMRILAVHRAIAAAILKGNGSVAERLMREHMEAFAKVGGKQNTGGLNGRITWR